MSGLDSDPSPTFPFPVDDAVRLRAITTEYSSRHGETEPTSSVMIGTATEGELGPSPGSVRGSSDQMGNDPDTYAVEVIKRPSSEFSPMRKYAAVGILFFVNLLNYTDRYILAGVLPRVKTFFQIGDSQSGLLQTVFILSYLVFSPIFGYLGDRYNRKLILIVGIAVWSGVTLAGSFVKQDHFSLFVVMRALVGIGEASYVTIAPTIISDMFVGSMRSRMLAFFYFAIPVGSGLGFIVGSNTALLLDKLDPTTSYASHWAWSFRVTPALGVLCVLFLLFVVYDPVRGEAEGTTQLENTSVLKDVKALLRNPSFVLSTWGNTCVAFISGALALFAPSLVGDKYLADGFSKHSPEVANSPLYFGIITVVAGIIGVLIGASLSNWLTPMSRRSDPLICATGLMLCGPFLYFVLFISEFNMMVAWVLIFFTNLFLSLNWSVVADMLLYVVIPTRRSMAEALQIAVSHLFGDAISPYIIGTMKDNLQVALPVEYESESLRSFIAMSRSLYICTFVAILGGGFFLFTSLFIERDRERVDQIVKGNTALISQSSHRTHSAAATGLSSHDYDTAPLLSGADDDDDDDDEDDNCAQEEVIRKEREDEQTQSELKEYRSDGNGSSTERREHFDFGIQKPV